MIDLDSERNSEERLNYFLYLCSESIWETLKKISSKYLSRSKVNKTNIEKDTFDQTEKGVFYRRRLA